MQFPMRCASLRAGVQRAVQGLSIAPLNAPSPACMVMPVRGFVTEPRTLTKPHAQAKRSFVAAPQENNSPSPQAPPSGVSTDSEPKAAKAPASNADPSEKWKEITVEMWRDAVYTNQTYFGELISDTAEFVKTIAEHIKLGGKRCSLVEVGCGTGEFTREATDEFRTVVGVDFNKEFIDFCKDNTIPRCVDKSRYLQGDACQLYSLLKDEFPKTPKKGSRGVEFWDDTRVVACVGNTIGIIPEELRPKVYEQMAEVAGDDGVVVMVYWNARWFGDACLNFYHKNPNLCGPFEGGNVDFKNSTLQTSTQYKTKWTSVDEARALMEDMGMEIISLREKGKGVFVAARRF